MIHCVWCVIVSQVALSEAVRRLFFCECRRHVKRRASPASAWSTCASSTGQCSYLFISMSFRWDMFCHLYISAKTESLAYCEVVKWSHSVMSDSLRPHGLSSAWNSPGQNTGVGSLSLLQGIFPTQGSNPGLPHCRRILYQLSHKERSCCIQLYFLCLIIMSIDLPRNEILIT